MRRLLMILLLLSACRTVPPRAIPESEARALMNRPDVAAAMAFGNDAPSGHRRDAAGNVTGPRMW